MRTLVLLTALLAGALATTTAQAAITVSNGLVFTRPDGSEVAYPPTVRVWCGAWEPDVPVRAIHVQVGRPGHGAYWRLSAVPGDVTRRRVVRFPHSFVFDAPTGAQLFAVDGENELSTAEEEARGRITFRAARCGPQLRIRFRIRATLGSEFFEGDELRVRGRFAASK